MRREVEGENRSGRNERLRRGKRGREREGHERRRRRRRRRRERKRGKIRRRRGRGDRRVRRRRRRRGIRRTEMSKGGKRGEESSGSVRPTPKVDWNETSREGRAGEEVTRGVRKKTAFRAEGIRGRAEPSLIATQLNAMSGPETRKAGADDARERGFRRTNRRRSGSQNPVRLIRTNRRSDVCSVDGFLDLTVEDVWNGATAKMLTDGRKISTGESVLHETRARWMRNDDLGRMLKARGAGEELRAEHIRVSHNGDDACFLVDVIQRRHSVTAGHQPKGGVLDGL